MKTNLLKKIKWYIAAFIFIAVLLSASLSFCSWDNMSLNARLQSNGSGDYKDVYKLVEDSNGNKLADVGDVVEFGNYYQSANDVEKSPIKWIVADKVYNDTSKQYELSLVSKYVLAFGSFWGVVYAQSTEWDTYAYGDISNGAMYQNYSQSTVRAWLNFDGTDKYERSDANTPFSLSSTDGVAFKGFYSQAFDAYERDLIIPKTISGIKGSVIWKNEQSDFENLYESYASVSDKVWLPSYSEIYGNEYVGENINEGLPNKHFEYFKDSALRIAYSTKFASSSMSNYTIKGIQPIWSGNWGKYGVPSIWQLRTPSAVRKSNIVLVSDNGAIFDNGHGSWDACQGVRPGIILPY